MSTGAEVVSEYSVAKLVRTALSRVVADVSREHILETLDRFDATYQDYGYDLEPRLALFSSDVVLEDPVGAILATNLSELEAFYRGVEGNGVRLDRRPVERIVIANEALVRYDSRIRISGIEPDTLPCTVHYTFNPAGKICKVRVFFNPDSVGKPISF
ncbi:hypothetical protein [Mycobacterium avium]|uniref:hypothetical protein n=1 Tax=Mycobacterium avium TaxID=1764 RepID=UPI001CC6F25E|nr:hypothetical protein [Mycobacterium avium]MBZ4521848.1 hypothetical protein [Mycobacterium avium subsp. hominissuis]MBZ4531231.1 hypothetical protein [Mycobacterium avium subsp. hominissuis]